MKYKIDTLFCVQRSALQNVETVDAEKDLLQIEIQGLQAELANHKQQLTDLQASFGPFHLALYEALPPAQHMQLYVIMFACAMLMHCWHMTPVGLVPCSHCCLFMDQ